MNVKFICKDACRIHGITHAQLIGLSRKKDCVAARKYVIETMRTRGASLPQIGRVLGNRDHTTILHHVQKMGLAPVDKRLYKNWAALVETAPPHTTQQQQRNCADE